MFLQVDYKYNIDIYFHSQKKFLPKVYIQFKFFFLKNVYLFLKINNFKITQIWLYMVTLLECYNIIYIKTSILIIYNGLNLLILQHIW